MAKIGNEAKLILKLAEERINAKIEHAKELRARAEELDLPVDARLRTGQIDGMWYAMTQYQSVIADLEKK